jgi:hypothetical protein
LFHNGQQLGEFDVDYLNTIFPVFVLTSHLAFIISPIVAFGISILPVCKGIVLHVKYVLPFKKQLSG